MQNSLLRCAYCAVKNSLLRCAFCTVKNLLLLCAFCAVNNPLLRCTEFANALNWENCVNGCAKHGIVVVVVRRMSFWAYLASVGWERYLEPISCYPRNHKEWFNSRLFSQWIHILHDGENIVAGPWNSFVIEASKKGGESIGNAKESAADWSCLSSSFDCNSSKCHRSHDGVTSHRLSWYNLL